LQFGAEKKRLFLDKLDSCGSIKHAAAEAGVGTGSIDWARRNDGAFRMEMERVLAKWEGRNAHPLPPPARTGGEGQALSPALSRNRRGGYREPRFDGFTARKRRRFIATLARTGCWADAARVAGISKETARRWRKKDQRFASLCAAAIDRASSHIETLAWERAVVGIEEPVIHYGKVVGTRVKRSDSIFRMLLMGSNRAKYGRMGAVDRKQVERELRAKVEEEVRGRMLPRVASDEEVREALTKALAAHGIRVRAEGKASREG
jgi:hypothetical protein